MLECKRVSLFRMRWFKGPLASGGGVRAGAATDRTYMYTAQYVTGNSRIYRYRHTCTAGIQAGKHRGVMASLYHAQFTLLLNCRAERLL